MLSQRGAVLKPLNIEIKYFRTRDNKDFQSQPINDTF